MDGRRTYIYIYCICLNCQNIYIYFRYLYVRWGTDLKKMVVFVGESGATDNEGLFAGVPKTVVLKGVGCGNGSNVYKELTSDRSNITQTGKDSTVDEIRSALCRLGVL